MSLALRNRGIVGGGSAPAFNILTDIAWDHAYYVYGPEFLALGYANTDPVTTFPDEIGTADFGNTGTNRPTLNTAYSGTGLSGAALVFDDAQDQRLTRASGTLMTQPNTTVVVALATGSTKDLVDGSGGSSRQLLDVNSGTWRMFAGTSRSTFHAVDDNGHLHIAFYDGASSYHILDGSKNTVSASPGTNPLGGTPQFFSTSSTITTGGALAFVGMYSGELSTDDQTAILAWAQSTFGTP